MIVDINAFVNSTVATSNEKSGARLGRARGTVTRPHALRRILSNLIENVLKFAGEAEVTVDKIEGDLCPA